MAYKCFTLTTISLFHLNFGKFFTPYCDWASQEVILCGHEINFHLQKWSLFSKWHGPPGWKQNRARGRDNQILNFQRYILLEWPPESQHCIIPCGFRSNYFRQEMVWYFMGTFFAYLKISKYQPFLTGLEYLGPLSGETVTVIVGTLF